MRSISFTLPVTSEDAEVTASAVAVYPNDTDAPRVISSAGNRFRTAHLLVFDGNGDLVEAGSDLLANEDGRRGSPQLSVTVPPRGFLIGFGNDADRRLFECYGTAFEGAMLYNATMAIRYPVKGSYDPEKGQVAIAYDPPSPASPEAVRFLFVGNSTTYFNGTPIKFKGLCLAAGIDADVTYCTFGSAYLHEFADPDHAYGKALREKLAGAHYDYVVLQDAGSPTAEETKASLDVLVPLVRESGAKPLLYMRYGADPAGQIVHYKTYTAMAEHFDAVAAPAAVAYFHCQRRGVEAPLFADDGAHHSAAGSYLIACTWLRAFLGVSPVGNAYRGNLDEKTALTLQTIALESCDTAFVPEP